MGLDGSGKDYLVSQRACLNNMPVLHSVIPSPITVRGNVNTS